MNTIENKEPYCTTKECSQTSCPWAFTEESEQIQNYGCLPTPMDIVRMRINHGKTWACHSNTDKPCLGTILALQEKGLPFKVIDPKLITEKDDWSLYVTK